MVSEKDVVASLYRVPLDGGAPVEIRLEGEFSVTRQLGPRALSRDGCL